MKSLLCKILLILTFPIWFIIGIIIMIILVIFSEDDPTDIIQGIGKGYTEKDLEDYYRKHPDE